jgi:oligopeptide/dipeptide ABC transporter ATP-binding protein
MNTPDKLSNPENEDVFTLSKDVILDVQNLRTHFKTTEGIVKAVDGASFTVGRGKVLGMVGESGCGKSVIAQSIMRIVPPPGNIVGGKILYQMSQPPASVNAQSEVIDLALLDAHGNAMRRIRGGEISMVFQEPMTSLDPVYTVGEQILEAITLHQEPNPRKARLKAIDALKMVGIPQPERNIDQYPHQLSGGMRQRVMIAIALSCHPNLLIADEPTTALDVTTEAQILDLMRNLQRELGTAILFITHNLGVVAEMCQDVAVMYLGKVVERADVDSLFYDPKHPYTRALLHSIPRLGKRTKARLDPIRGSVPEPYSIPQGCPFWPRCADNIPGKCDVDEPSNTIIQSGHEVRCHLFTQAG